MNLKTQFKKADIENYQMKINKLDKEIEKLTKTKEMWKLRLKNKLKELL